MISKVCLLAVMLIAPMAMASTINQCKTDYYIGGPVISRNDSMGKKVRAGRKGEMVHGFKYIGIKYNENLISYGDALLPLKTCPKSKEWNCVFGADIQLAVPSKMSGNQTEWSYESSRYRIINARTIWLMGKEIEIKEIARYNEEKSGDFNVYYLSNDKQLVGFSLFFDDERTPVLYWLMESESSFGSCKLLN